jgi:hypothetical protein
MPVNHIFESHYYAAGQKYFPFGERPAWAPSAERVGVSQEAGIPLRSGDYILELARVIEQGRFVFWFGLFEKGVDRVYGDRGENTVGVGLWVEGAVVTNPGEVGDILHQLLTKQSSLADPRDMTPLVERASKFLKLSSRDLLPSAVRDGRSGVSFGEGMLHRSVVWHAKIPNYGEGLFSQVASFINLFQFMSQKFLDVNKIYLVISKEDSSAYKSVSFAGTIPSKKLDYDQEVATMLLGFGDSARAAEGKPARDILELTSRLESCDREKKSAQAELAILKKSSVNPQGSFALKLDQLLGAVQKLGDIVSAPALRPANNLKSGNSLGLIIALCAVCFLVTLSLVVNLFAAHQSTKKFNQLNANFGQVSAAVKNLDTGLERTSAASSGVSGAAGITSGISSGDNAGVPVRWQGRYRITKGSPSETSACGRGVESEFLTVTEFKIEAPPASSCGIALSNEANVYKCMDDPGKSFEFSEGQLVSKEPGSNPKKYKLCPQ